jgi:uncharacterized membrane protein YbhN (UPF0104 family)
MVTRRRLIRLLIVAACVAAMVWTLARLGPGRVLEVASRADPFWLALSVVPVLGRFFIWGYKWWRILRREWASAEYWRSLRILLCGSFVNLTTPTAKLAGGVLRAALLKRRHGWRMSRAYGRAFSDQATNAIGTVALYGVLASTVAVVAGDLEHRAAFGISGVLALIAVATALSLRGWAWRQIQRPRLGDFVRRLTPQRLRESEGGEPGSGIRAIFYPLLGEGPTHRTLLTDVIWAAVSFGSICVANAMVLRSLGVETSPWVVSASVVLGYFAGILVGVSGGIGVTEAAITVLYIQAGIPAEVATAGALLHRATFYIVVLLGGGASLLYESRANARLRRATGITETE